MSGELFVDQHAGIHMREILEAMNASGMFGPVLESSLDMLSPKKRDAIARTLLRAAINTWDDGMELSIRIEIGKYDLYVAGFHYIRQ